MNKTKTTHNKRWKYIKINNLEESKNINLRDIDYLIVKHPPQEDDTDWKECDGENIIKELRDKYDKKDIWIIFISTDHSCIYNPSKKKANYLMGSPEGIFRHLLSRD